MDTNHRSEQEKFWAGSFGTEYIRRNQGNELLNFNTNLFNEILKKAPGIRSIIEFGPNIGMNLRALHQMYPSAELGAVEINPSAAEHLNSWGKITQIVHDSIASFTPSKKYDLAFTKGVLIHINPDDLGKVYERLHQSSSRYIAIVEYFSKNPEEVPYHGNRNKLFRRDFAAELLDRFKDLTLVDYGFIYGRDPRFDGDDYTWFLLKKNNG